MLSLLLRRFLSIILWHTEVCSMTTNCPSFKDFCITSSSWFGCRSKLPLESSLRSSFSRVYVFVSVLFLVTSSHQTQRKRVSDTRLISSASPSSPFLLPTLTSPHQSLQLSLSRSSLLLQKFCLSKTPTIFPLLVSGIFLFQKTRSQDTDTWESQVKEEKKRDNIYSFFSSLHKHFLWKPRASLLVKFNKIYSTPKPSFRTWLLRVWFIFVILDHFMAGSILGVSSSFKVFTSLKTRNSVSASGGVLRSLYLFHEEYNEILSCFSYPQSSVKFALESQALGFSCLFLFDGRRKEILFWREVFFLLSSRAVLLQLPDSLCMNMLFSVHSNFLFFWKEKLERNITPWNSLERIMVMISSVSFFQLILKREARSALISCKDPFSLFALFALKSRVSSFQVFARWRIISMANI